MTRDLVITTMPGVETAWFDCSFLPARAMLNRTLTFRGVGVVNCHTGAC
jgi:hypothetical protein